MIMGFGSSAIIHPMSPFNELMHRFWTLNLLKTTLRRAGNIFVRVFGQRHGDAGRRVARGAAGSPPTAASWSPSSAGSGADGARRRPFALNTSLDKDVGLASTSDWSVFYSYSLAHKDALDVHLYSHSYLKPK